MAMSSDSGQDGASELGREGCFVYDLKSNSWMEVLLEISVKDIQ